MKKIFVLLTILAFAAPAFATDINSTTGTSIGGGVYKPSQKVIVSFVATSTDYSAGAKHEQGTKGYVTTSAEPKISDFACDAGDTKVTVSDATTLGSACE